MSELSKTAVPIPPPQVKIYNAQHIREITKTEEFELSDMMLQDIYGTVVWTTVWTTLFGKQQSLYFDANRNLRYEIQEGEAWFTYTKTGEVVVAGDNVLVPANTKHKVWNTSRTQVCKYRFDYPGLLDMRKHLDKETFTIED